jgi:hypothetical protein
LFHAAQPWLWNKEPTAHSTELAAQTCRKLESLDGKTFYHNYSMERRRGGGLKRLTRALSFGIVRAACYALLERYA